MASNLNGGNEEHSSEKIRYQISRTIVNVMEHFSKIGTISLHPWFESITVVTVTHNGVQALIASVARRASFQREEFSKGWRNDYDVTKYHIALLCFVAIYFGRPISLNKCKLREIRMSRSKRHLIRIVTYSSVVFLIFFSSFLYIVTRNLYNNSGGLNTGYLHIATNA